MITATRPTGRPLGDFLQDKFERDPGFGPSFSGAGLMRTYLNNPAETTATRSGLSYEHLWFVGRFGACEFVEAEVTSIGGALPVSPSGGLESKLHPPGATGVAQGVELFGQLRADAVNQVDVARIELAHNIGGTTALAAVAIVEGPGTGGD